MSDNEIRAILLKQKKEAMKRLRREEIRETVEAAIGWVSIAGICFMLSVIG